MSRKLPTLERKKSKFPILIKIQLSCKQAPFSEVSLSAYTDLPLIYWSREDILMTHKNYAQAGIMVMCFYDPQEDTADLVPIQTVNQTCSPHGPPLMRAMVILSNLLVTANILHTVSYRTTSTHMFRISRNTAMTTVFGKDQISITCDSYIWALMCFALGPDIILFVPSPQNL